MSSYSSLVSNSDAPNGLQRHKINFKFEIQILKGHKNDLATDLLA